MTPTPDPDHILIIGGGFAGFWAALRPGASPVPGPT